MCAKRRRGEFERSLILSGSKNLQRAAAAALLSLVAIGTGCETKSWLDPSEMGRYELTPQVVPILDKLVVGVEKDEAQFANAREVTEADLQPDAVDYRVGANDLLQISIQDLAGNGLQQVETKKVSESGKISLPYLGQVSVVGQTEAEVEDTIVRAYADAQILPRAIVSVAVVDAKNLLYTISGAVNQAGAYPLNRSDLRLSEALANARGVTSELGIDYVYVIRKKAPTATETAPAGPENPGVDPLAPQSRVKTVNSPVFLMKLQDAPPPQTPEEARKAAEELANQINKTVSEAQPANNDPLTPPLPAETPSAVPGDVTDRVIQIDGAGTQPATAEGEGAMQTPALEPTPAMTDSSDFEFVAPAEPTDREVIRVPYAQLSKNGELKYDLILRPGDLIVVPSPPIGEYYMGGHVARPGVYSLTARNITLKQAIISAGMLDQLAIPTRTDVIRRLSKNQEVFVRVDLEKIFGGIEPDILLKPDDQVMVGTNAGATFLAALRNSFRFTYGFGFLYDRNYAPSNQNQ
jgi:protein involved in polysaccharide export with SLBB domain